MTVPYANGLAFALDAVMTRLLDSRSLDDLLILIDLSDRIDALPGPHADHVNETLGDARSALPRARQLVNELATDEDTFEPLSACLAGLVEGTVAAREILPFGRAVLRVARVAQLLPPAARGAYDEMLADLRMELAIEPERWLPLAQLARDRVVHEPFDTQPTIVQALLEEFGEVGIEVALRVPPDRVVKDRVSPQPNVAVRRPTARAPASPRHLQRPVAVQLSRRLAPQSTQRAADGSLPTVLPDAWLAVVTGDGWELAVAEHVVDDQHSTLLVRIARDPRSDPPLDLSADGVVWLLDQLGGVIALRRRSITPELWLGEVDGDVPLQIRIDGVTVQVAATRETP